MAVGVGDLGLRIAVFAADRAGFAGAAGGGAGRVGLQPVVEASRQVQLAAEQRARRAGGQARTLAAGGAGMFTVDRRRWQKTAGGQQQCAIGEPGAVFGVDPDHERRCPVPAGQLAECLQSGGLRPGIENLPQATGK